MAGHQIVDLRIGVQFSSITFYGQVSIAAIAADCKSATHAVNIAGSIPALPTTQGVMFREAKLHSLLRKHGAQIC